MSIEIAGGGRWGAAVVISERGYPNRRVKRRVRFRIAKFGVESICKSNIGDFGTMQARIWLILGLFLVFCVFGAKFGNVMIRNIKVKWLREGKVGEAGDGVGCLGGG